MDSLCFMVVLGRKAWCRPLHQAAALPDRGLAERRPLPNPAAARSPVLPTAGHALLPSARPRWPSSLGSPGMPRAGRRSARCLATRRSGSRGRDFRGGGCIRFWEASVAAATGPGFPAMAGSSGEQGEWRGPRGGD